MDKFRHKLPKEDLKKFAKEIAKKLVASDYKHNRVEDPTKITPNQEKKVKKHVKEFFDKAVAKKAEHDRKKAEKQRKAETGIYSTKDAIVNGAPDSGVGSETPVKVEESDDMDMSDEEENEQVIPSGPATPILNTPSDEGLKRKREDLAESFNSTPSETPSKRFKDEDAEVAPSPPPPPPPPPAEDLQMQIDEEAELAAQEEALMRENEEALMLENEEAMKDAELRKGDANVLLGGIDDVDAKVNGLKKDKDGEDIAMKEVNGNMIMKMEAGALDSEHGAKDVSETNGVDEKRDTIQHERKQVLSH
jgi:histone-lysine N-methyltransferase SETD2